MTKADWNLLTVAQRKSFGNGCGPQAIQQWIPEGPWNGTCRQHDWEWRKYGSTWKLFLFNFHFLFEMIQKIFTHGWLWALTSPLWIWLALCYWIGVTLLLPWHYYEAGKITGHIERSQEEMIAYYEKQMRKK